MRLFAVWVLAGAVTVGVLHISMPVAAAEDPAQDPAQMVTGTVVGLDLAQLKLAVKTDLKKNIYVDVAQPDLLRELQAGDRVTLRLDAQGKADKITKLTVPELPASGGPEPASGAVTRP